MEFTHDFTDNAARFIRLLRGTRDDNSRVQQQRIELIAHTEAFTTAWSTFAHVYYDLPTQGVFDHLLNNLINDNSQIVARLSQKLTDATLANRRERKRAMFHFFRPTGILGTFFGYGETCLRQSQILYATAVVNLITLVVIHVKSHGYVNSSGDHWHAIQRDQRETIRNQEQAWRALQVQEQHFRDNLVHPHSWLRGFQWMGEPDRLPLAMVASTWFHVTPSDPSIIGPRAANQGPWLDQILAQMQADRERSNARYQELERRWNRRYAQQQAEWQRLYNELNTERAILQQELDKVRQERDQLIRDVEQLGGRIERSEPEVSDAEEFDEAILALEVKKDLMDAERRGLDQERPVPEPKRRVSEAENVVLSHNDQRTPETPNYVTNLSPALEVARGRTSLSVRHPPGPSNKSRYPPQAPVKWSKGRRRESTPDTRPRSSSRGSHSSSLSSGTTAVGSISIPSPQQPGIMGHSRLKLTSRSGSQDAGVREHDIETDDSFVKGHRNYYQQDYEHGRRRTSRGRSLSSGREHEHPYRTPPSQQYGDSDSAGCENLYPQPDAIGKQYDSQLFSDRPRDFPSAAQRNVIQLQQQTSYQGSVPLTLGFVARV